MRRLWAVHSRLFMKMDDIWKNRLTRRTLQPWQTMQFVIDFDSDKRGNNYEICVNPSSRLRRGNRSCAWWMESGGQIRSALPCWAVLAGTDWGKVLTFPLQLAWKNIFAWLGGEMQLITTVRQMVARQTHNKYTLLLRKRKYLENSISAQMQNGSRHVI